ncbi:E3 ubiquitin-protein ligase RFWD3 [Rhynchospora pubera]|uniref:RING-type E3 ubiquitin transferase n=1 Tax=Rhynchospora pubera TaxID=906938 RepID=A0AAV8E3C0_9POAL|nr:E3 ubiquitin-protein ligase RFWD3 [Rhynchospora pubera]
MESRVIYRESRVISRRGRQPPQEDEPDDSEEEEPESESESESGSGTDTSDDTSSSDTDTEPETAVDPPQVQPQRLQETSAVAVGVIEVEEGEEDEEGNEGGGKSEGSVEILEGKGKENVGVESGDNSALPTCPICMDTWSPEGLHRVCCIPCGHIYGRSCLEKWLRKCGNKGKCPQCNSKFNPKQIINLYAPRIVVPNDDLEKEVHCLREKNESLTLEKARLLKEIHKQREQLEEEQRSKKQKIRQTSLLEFSDQRQNLSVGSLPGTATSPSRFFSLNEFRFDGARVMAINASNQTVIVSSKAPGIPCEHILNKISLLDIRGIEKIKLPSNTKTVKDLCILPNGNVALASLGRKLAVFSMTSNNFVFQYDLPAPGWSCCGDDANAHCIYVGLQNGKLLVFDVRRTAHPVECLDGLTTHPIHTVHSLNSAGTSRVLTASSLGPCVWDINEGAERPTLVPGLDNPGICISLACADDNIVATFRPRLHQDQPETLPSQYQISPSPPLSNSGKLGIHILMKRAPDGISFCTDQVCHGNVSELRMSKSAIICSDRNAPLFAYGDEMLRGVRIWGLPSFNWYTDLNPHREPLLDLRYARGSSGPGFLGSLCEEKLQVFRCI